MYTFTDTLKPGQHVTYIETLPDITGTVTNVTRRDQSLYYIVELTLDSGEHIKIQKHKNTLFITKD